MDIFEVLERLGKKRGVNYSRAKLKAAYNEHVEKWKAHYRGDVPGINSDTGFNGQDFFPIRRESMKVAKLIAQKWATSLFSEAFKITLKDDAETAKFNELEKQIDFRSKINQCAIFAYAEGTAALLASADVLVTNDGMKKTVSGGKIKLDTIRYDNLFPLAFDQNDITAIAFVKQTQEKDKTIYTISIHSTLPDSGKIEIENIVATVRGESVDFTAADKTVTVKEVFNNQMYAWIKPNTANDFTETLPFGASIFSDAIAPVTDTDLAADLLRRDITEGGQLTFVGRDILLQAAGKDKQKKIFENSKGRFFVIPQKLAETGSDTKQLFQRCVPVVRVNELWQVVKDSLNWASMTSGLGRNSLDIIPMQTATQVVHTQSEKMLNKALHEQFLEGQIIKLVRALCELSSLVGSPIDSEIVNITWHDSVIIDEGEEKKLSMAEVDQGLISKAEYRNKFYGETLEVAQAKIDAIAETQGGDDQDYDYDTTGADIL